MQAVLSSGCLFDGKSAVCLKDARFVHWHLLKFVVVITILAFAHYSTPSVANILGGKQNFYEVS
ncbi:hypothetical protein HED55_18615 [Ochrobactrum haematophilum]|uniref:Uncharacterized protein n=1 Tax=Brucella haematophila TaxID=419474 RepID=A0ABX1DNV9_9HYPH|nr:hypothetical protein [Brucella haematophila]